MGRRSGATTRKRQHHAAPQRAPSARPVGVNAPSVATTGSGAVAERLVRPVEAPHAVAVRGHTKEIASQQGERTGYLVLALCVASCWLSAWHYAPAPAVRTSASIAAASAITLGEPVQRISVPTLAFASRNPLPVTLVAAAAQSRPGQVRHSTVGTIPAYEPPAAEEALSLISRHMSVRPAAGFLTRSAPVDTTAAMSLRFDKRARSIVHPLIEPLAPEGLEQSGEVAGDPHPYALIGASAAVASVIPVDPSSSVLAARAENPPIVLAPVDGPGAPSLGPIDPAPDRITLAPELSSASLTPPVPPTDARAVTVQEPASPRIRRRPAIRPPFPAWPSFEPPLTRHFRQPTLAAPTPVAGLLPSSTSDVASDRRDSAHTALAAMCPAERSQHTGTIDNRSEGPIAVDTEEGQRKFGLALAHAAMAQTSSFLIYSVSYTRIAYPRGDVPAMYGVCTDVIIRAYRSLGIDLQELVHLGSSRSGDRNIQHRRTEVLRPFFARQGASLPVTDYPEDYLPGDIVTYHRPNNTASKSHIAIVTDIIAPSGRPMIVHNRGWGVQIEDALFLDQVTGHYRYFGPATVRGDAAVAAVPAASAGTSIAGGLVRASLVSMSGRTAWSASGPAPDCGRGERAIITNRDTRLCAPSRASLVPTTDSTDRR